MADALKALRGLNLHEVERRLCEERRLLNAAYSMADYDPDGASRKRSAAKGHQYRVGQMVKGK